MLGPSTSAIRINELLPLPGLRDWDGDGLAAGNDSYVELYNTYDLYVRLAGYRLEASGQVDSYTFPAGALLAPRAFLVLYKDRTHLELLGAPGTHWLRLIDPTGAIVQTVYYTAPGLDQSYTATVNGGEDWVISDPSLPNPEDARIRRTARGHAPRSRREREEERRRRQHEEETEERRHRMAVFQELSLADAKNLPEGAGVRVKAAVNASPGTFFRNEWFVQDDSAGLQVRLRHHRPPRLKENELVILDGRITHRRGQTTLLIEEPYHVFELGAGAPLVPLPLRPGDLSADNEGRLVRVSGVVARRADQNLWLADGGSEALIHLWAHHFDRTPPPLLGQQVAVVGINGYYRTSASPRAPWPRLWRPLQRQTAEGAYHLLPRRPADLSTGSGEDRAFNSMLPLRVGSPLSPSGELPGAGAVSAWPRLPATGGGRELERVAAECAC